MNGKIHFLNTGYSDCIILESNGHIAMVDAAEDTEYPADKPNLKLPGYEETVVNYLKKHFADERGKVHIDFVLGTHCHSDHIGGFDTVINDADIIVDTAYLKPYHEEDIFVYEVQRWDNKEVYTQMLDAIKKNHVRLVEEFDREQVKLGDFSVTFYNGTYKKHSKTFGENINSVVTLIEIGDKKVLLAGDFNDKDGDEKKLSKILPNVDILKVAHHGYPYSTTVRWLKALKPKYAVVCNYYQRIYPQVWLRLKLISRSKILATAANNGVLAEFSDNTLSLKYDIM